MVIQMYVTSLENDASGWSNGVFASEFELFAIARLFWALFFDDEKGLLRELQLCQGFRFIFFFKL